jgi:hypothetical protein
LKLFSKADPWSQPPEPAAQTIPGVDKEAIIAMALSKRMER